MRLACLYVPSFPVQALRRVEPELVEAPLAVVAGPSLRDTVVCVAAEAAERGVVPGMTAAQARQVVSDVLLREVPGVVASAAGEALADVALSFTPRFASTRPGEAVLDVGGVTVHWGSEARMAAELAHRCFKVGLEARVGVASSAGVARVAARGGTEVVPAGTERTFVAPLPVEVLEPSPRAAEALARWGVRRATELAAIPRAEVVLRLGGEGVALHRLASGEETAPFVPEPRREVLREAVALEDPIASLEAFTFVLHGLLGRLARRLELRGEGFAAIDLELDLDGGGRHSLAVRMVAPTLEVTAVEALTRLKLEAHPPEAAVERVTAQVTPGSLRLVQGSLFGPPRPAPGKLAMTLARLAALMGPERVGAPAVPDTHRPGAFALVPFAPPESSGGDEVESRPRPPVLRAFRPPLEAQVTVVGSRPLAVRAHGVGGVVAGCAGPYRFRGEWWTEEPYARDDFDVATSDGSLLRISYDRLAKRWYVDGTYD